MKPTIGLIFLVVLLSCNASQTDAEEVHLRVNSHTVECYGEMEGICLLVQEGEKLGTEDWEYFYYEDSIDGFDYEEGYVYDLMVRKIPVEDPPQDASSIKYELVRILSKEKVQE